MAGKRGNRYDLRAEQHPLLVFADLSPEARRHEAELWRAAKAEPHRPRSIAIRAAEVFHRVWNGVWNDGFIHAGNFAYMVLIALFPFFITGAWVFSLVGEGSARGTAIRAVMAALPPVIVRALEPVGREAIAARSGWLLWAGGLVGLWTVGSLIETIRDILRRAYGTQWEHAFWRYRLASTAMVLGAMVLLLASMGAQMAIGAALEAMHESMPELASRLSGLSLSRFIPAAALLFSLYLLFLALTPGAYRNRQYPKWPGAVLVAAWWLLLTGVLPGILRRFFTYNLTYGSLAGVMIALFFFWLVGLGMVVGAELNAALSETPEEREMEGRTANRVPVGAATKDGTEGA